MSQTETDIRRRDRVPPSGWVRTNFGTLYELIYGKSLPNATRNPDGDYAVYGSNGIVGHHDTFLVEHPVLIVGRKGAVGSVSLSSKPCWPIDTTYFIRDSKYVDIRFSFYLLESLRLNQFDRSTAIPGLNRDDAYNIVVDLPPLPEQHRIVTKIEELFSELDKGIESLKAARAKLDIYRQAVLKHAFNGKLTAQWREENKEKIEMPERLLTRITNKREARYERKLQKWKDAVKEWEGKGRIGKKPSKPRKSTDVYFVPRSGSLGALPEGWRWTAVSEIADLVTDGTHHTPNYTSSGVPFISVKDVRQGKVNFDDCRFISRDDHDVLIHRCHPEPGDLLITKSGTIGRLAIVPDKEISLFVSVALVKIQSTQGLISPKWFRYAFEHHILGLNIDQQIKGGLLKNYHLEDLRMARLPLCDDHEQEELVRQIEVNYSRAEEFDAILEQQLVRADTLRHSILQRAFSGQLVPQDPNDEPASILLERIKNEKNARSQDNKRTKRKREKATV